MTSISNYPHGVRALSNLISLHSSLVVPSFPYSKSLMHPRLFALKTGSDGGKIGSQEALGSDLLRKPIISPTNDINEEHDEGKRNFDEENEERDEEKWVDWEDRILEDTVPLVGFVRMILHSAKYGNGDRLSPDHEKTIIERLLPYHPECEKKIGCGVDYITVGYHPDFETSRCLFIVRKDGELVDFSYWKCIKGLIRKNYPLYADTFILRHFRRRSRS